MKRFVLKLADNMYVTSLNWIIITLPVVKTGRFDDALIVEESYLDEVIGHNGYEQSLTRKDLLVSQYPTIQPVPVKIVLDESQKTLDKT